MNLVILDNEDEVIAYPIEDFVNDFAEMASNLMLCCRSRGSRKRHLQSTAEQLIESFRDKALTLED